MNILFLQVNSLQVIIKDKIIKLPKSVKYYKITLYLWALVSRTQWKFEREEFEYYVCTV